MNAIGLRAARALDAGTVGGIMAAANARLDWMPRLYSGAEVISFAGAMIDAGWVRVAHLDDQIVGFLARQCAEVHGLFLRPDLQGRGIARALMAEAQGEAPELGLWSFQQNARASRFYRKAGFHEVTRTDGHSNDARLPDIRFEWHKEST